MRNYVNASSATTTNYDGIRIQQNMDPLNGKGVGLIGSCEESTPNRVQICSAPTEFHLLYDIARPHYTLAGYKLPGIPRLQRLR